MARALSVPMFISCFIAQLAITIGNAGPQLYTQNEISVLAAFGIGPALRTIAFTCFKIFGYTVFNSARVRGGIFMNIFATGHFSMVVGFASAFFTCQSKSLMAVIYFVAVNDSLIA